MEPNHYTRVLALLSKVDKWHVRREIDCNEEFDGMEIRDEELQSMKMVVMDVVNAAVFGSGGPQSTS